MRDPYLFDDIPVLKNKLGIRDQNLLDDAEADYVVYRLKNLALNPLSGDYKTKHLLDMHEYLFKDLFEWASLAQLWKIHPFREGNTRTTITFCCQFADEMGFPLNRKLFEENSRYVRTALVAYNAFFSNGSNFSKKEYLERIVYDALNG